MKTELSHTVLKAFILAQGQATLQIHGTSMEPCLKEGDQVVVKVKDSYSPGEILLYRFQENRLLIHRYLRKEGSIYLCKGDNAFRIEGIRHEEIYGYVISINNRKAKKLRWPLWKCILSFAVGKTAERNKYNLEKTKKQCLFRIYSLLILHMKPKNSIPKS